MDYAFLSREHHGRSLTLLVCKDSGSITVMASVVMQKGCGLEEIVGQAVENLLRLWCRS